MGDRVLVTFTDDNKNYSPAIYMHSMGSEAQELIEQSVGSFRRNDASYSAARFCVEMGKRLTGIVGLGLVEGPVPTDTGFSWADYSHGDAGVYVVHLTTGEVQAHAGYGKPFQLDPAQIAA